AQVAEDADFEVDIVGFNHFSLFFGVRMFLPGQTDAVRRANPGALITNDAFIRIKILDSTEAIRHLQGVIRISVGDSFLRKVFERDAQTFYQSEHGYPSVFRRAGRQPATDGASGWVEGQPPGRQALAFPVLRSRPKTNCRSRALP